VYSRRGAIHSAKSWSGRPPTPPRPISSPTPIDWGQRMGHRSRGRRLTIDVRATIPATTSTRRHPVAVADEQFDQRYTGCLPRLSGIGTSPDMDAYERRWRFLERQALREILSAFDRAEDTPCAIVRGSLPGYRRWHGGRRRRSCWGAETELGREHFSGRLVAQACAATLVAGPVRHRNAPFSHVVCLKARIRCR